MLLLKYLDDFLKSKYQNSKIPNFKFEGYCDNGDMCIEYIGSSNKELIDAICKNWDLPDCVEVENIETDFFDDYYNIYLT